MNSPVSRTALSTKLPTEPNRALAPVGTPPERALASFALLRGAGAGVGAGAAEGMGTRFGVMVDRPVRATFMGIKYLSQNSADTTRILSTLAPAAVAAP